MTRASQEILTVSLTVLDPFNLKPEQINAFDIAWSLFGQNRYLHHTPISWSVLQHIGLCYVLAVAENHQDWNSEIALALLLHDAAEAYLGDVPRPIKERPEFAFFREAEDRALAVIYQRFGLEPGLMSHPLIERYDKQAAHVEAVWFNRYDAASPHSQPQYPIGRVPQPFKGDVNSYITMLKETVTRLDRSVDTATLFKMPATLVAYLSVSEVPSTQHETAGPQDLGDNEVQSPENDILNRRL